MKAAIDAPPNVSCVIVQEEIHFSRQLSDPKQTITHPDEIKDLDIYLL